MTDAPSTEAAPQLVDLLAEISVILFNHDPLGISFSEDSGEYMPVAELLLPHLDGCSSTAEVATALFEVADSIGTGSPKDVEALQAAADEIWAFLGD